MIKRCYTQHIRNFGYNVFESQTYPDCAISWLVSGFPKSRNQCLEVPSVYACSVLQNNKNLKEAFKTTCPELMRELWGYTYSLVDNDIEKKLYLYFILCIPYNTFLCLKKYKKDNKTKSRTKYIYF